MLLTPWHVMRSFLYMSKLPAPFDFDPRSLPEQYSEFEDSFYEDDIHCEAIAPLDLIKISAHEIKLSPDVEISRITTDERSAAQMFELITDTGSSDKKLVVRVRYTLPKFIGPVDEYHQTDSGPAIQLTSAIDARIENVIDTLRAFKSGRLRFGGIIHRPHTWLYKGLDTDRLVSRSIDQNSGRYSLDNEEETIEFGIFWKQLQQPRVMDLKFLTVALRRLAFASERQRNEDKMIDVLIAAEALFLSDVGNGPDRGELTHRLAQRAGWFLGATPTERIAISQHMRKAYRVRSAIVHGSHDLPLPNDPCGQGLSLKDFVAITEAYVRLALHKLISLASEPLERKNLVHWNELVFGLSVKGDD